MQINKRDLYGVRIALAMMTVVLSLGLLLSRIPTLMAQDTCPAALPTRLSVGTQGRVRSDGPNDLHAEPSLNASYAGEVQALGVFDIVQGPVCADDAVWWQVNFFGLIGWTQEGRDDVYWLNPHTAATPAPRPTVIATAVSSQGTAVSSQVSVPEVESLETLWTQTFDDPATWAQTSSDWLPGEVKEGAYMMPTTAMQEAYAEESATFVDDVTSVPSLASYKISFDVQSERPDLESECGLIVVNPNTPKEVRLLFCHRSLTIMPAAYDPMDDSPASVKTMESPVDPMDGGVHRISLTADGQKLRLYVDGQGGLAFSYPTPLTSFLLVHIDTRLGVSEPQGQELARFDNLTLSVAPECLYIMTITIKELVVGPINSTPFTAPVAVSLRYGIYYDANESDEQTQNEDGIWDIVYNADIVVGDRVTGFPPLTRTVRCTGWIKSGYYRILEKDEYLSDRGFHLSESSFGTFPEEEIHEFNSYPSARRYQLSYRVEVQRVWGAPIDTASVDMTTIQIEHNPPQ